MQGELEEARLARAKLKRDLEEATAKISLQLEVKENELHDTQQELATLQGRMIDANEELEDQQQELDEKRRRLKEADEQYGKLESRLQAEADEEQQQLREELAAAKTAKGELAG